MNFRLMFYDKNKNLSQKIQVLKSKQVFGIMINIFKISKHILNLNNQESIFWEV